MSHEITVREDGTAEAAYAMVPAWHGLGTVVDHVMNSEEAIKIAELDWEVAQYPLTASRGTMDDGRPWDIPVPGHLANVRTDNDRVLGVVSEHYRPIQNRQAFDFVDGLLQDGIIKYESCGSLKGGRIVWLLARMPQEFEVASGDTLLPYILFSTSHDGSRAVRCLPTSVRVVCWNTYTMATAREDQGIVIRHAGDLDAKMDAARKAVMGIQEEFADHGRDALRLAASHVDLARLTAYVNVLIPDEEGVRNDYRQRTRDAILTAFRDGPQMIPSIAGTAWAAWNSVTQVVDHASIYRARGTDDPRENRMISTLWGSNARLKRSAMTLALTTLVA